MRTAGPGSALFVPDAYPRPLATARQVAVLKHLFQSPAESLFPRVVEWLERKTKPRSSADLVRDVYESAGMDTELALVLPPGDLKALHVRTALEMERSVLPGGAGHPETVMPALKAEISTQSLTGFARVLSLELSESQRMQLEVPYLQFQKTQTGFLDLLLSSTRTGRRPDFLRLNICLSEDQRSIAARTEQLLNEAAA